MHLVHWELWREPGGWPMASSLHSANRTSLTAQVERVLTTKSLPLLTYSQINYVSHL